MMSIADEIAKFDALRQSGAITEEEYERSKTALLEQQVSGPPEGIRIGTPSFDTTTPLPPISDPHHWQEINGKKTAAGVLALVFGFLAVHKFYLGKYTAGFIALILCIVTLGFGCFIMSPIAWYEGVKYLRMSPEEFEQTYIVQKKDWF
jgi:TM2 domain-containing membrane protein YozV